MTEEIDCNGTYVLICPYCGKNQRREHFDLSDYEDHYECSYCHEIFEYEREVILLYTSKKLGSILRTVSKLVEN